MGTRAGPLVVGTSGAHAVNEPRAGCCRHRKGSPEAPKSMLRLVPRSKASSLGADELCFLCSTFSVRMSSTFKRVSSVCYGS